MHISVKNEAQHHTAGCSVSAEPRFKSEVLRDEVLTENPLKFKTRVWIKKQHFNHGTFTYIDQAKVMFIHRELLRTNLFLQSRGIGALQRNSMVMLEKK